MEFKGTKGKWFSSSLEIISMPTQTKIGKISGNNYEEARFNAQLISKAPEMLDMLKKIMKTYDKGTQTYLDCQKLIKEATEI
jgi:hypothetical protein